MRQEIPVWVINLNKRPDRLKKIAKRLDDLGIEWNRLEAVDGSNSSDLQLEISKRNGEIGAISNGARACSASHSKFWKELVLSKLKFGIILEDDVELSDDFKDLVTSITWIPKNSHLIKLEKASAHKTSKLLLGPELSDALNNSRHVRKMYSRHCGTAAYLLSSEGAEIALSWKRPFTVPIDHLLFNETVSNLVTSMKPLILIPPIAWQSDEIGGGSDITKFKVAHMGRLKKLFRSIKRGYYELRLLPYQLFLLLIRKAKIISVSKK